MKTKIMILALAAMSSASAMAQDVKYFNDYASIYGVAQGRGEVSPEAMKHRSNTYKFMYKDGRLDSVAKVNSNGELCDDYVAYKYFYCDNGKVDYILKKNVSDYVMLDYNDDFTMLTYRYPGDKNSVRLAFMPWSFNFYMLDYSLNLVNVKDRYTYDSKGRAIKVEHLDADGNPTLDILTYAPVTEFKYNDADMVIEERCFDYDGSPCSNYSRGFVVNYEYNDEGYLSAYKAVDKQGEPILLGKQAYSYDQYGNLIKTVYGDNDWTNVYNYDEKGNLVRENTEYDKKAEKYNKKLDKELAETREVIERNSIGHITRYAIYRKGKLQEDYRIKYNERGFMSVAENVLLTKGYEGEVYSKIEFEFDPKTCLPSKITYYDKNGKLERSEERDSSDFFIR